MTCLNMLVFPSILHMPECIYQLIVRKGISSDTHQVMKLILTITNIIPEPTIVQALYLPPQYPNPHPFHPNPLSTHLYPPYPLSPIKNRLCLTSTQIPKFSLTLPQSLHKISSFQHKILHKLNKQKTNEDEKHKNVCGDLQSSVKRLKRNRTLLIKNSKGSSMSKEVTPKIKDTDSFNDAVKNGYSQYAKGDSMVSNRSVKRRKSNHRNLLKDPKFQQNVYLDKAFRPPKMGAEESRHISAESKEVNRIFNVLQNNLISPQGGKIGMKNSAAQDPKRSQVRQLLQKHFHMKEQEMQQSDDTLLLKMSDFEPSVLKGLSALMQNLEEESKFSQCNEGSENDNNFEPCKQESFEASPEDSFLTASMRNTKADISVQFEDISRISSSSGSEKMKEEAKPNAPTPTSERKYIKGHSELDIKRMKIMLAMVQIYRMVKSDNPFDFSQMLKVWSLLKRS